MARPRKNTVDYFPHICNQGKTIYILEQRYGNDGYAFWFKLLEMIATTENHFIDITNQEDLEFMSSKMRLLPTQTIEILDLLARLNAIDQKLWENNIIWSDNFIKNIADVYSRRNGYPPSIPVIDDTNKVIVDDNPQNDVDNPQSKLKYIKVNETKEIASKLANEQDITLARLLFSLIKENTPTFKEPNLDKWAEDISKIIRLDERTYEQVEYLIKWSQNNDFWQGNILSPIKLRKQFDTLVAQVKRDKPKITIIG